MKIERITRKTYILTSLLIIGLNYLLYHNLSIQTDNELRNFSVYIFVLFIIIFLLNAGRLNDINLSGWYALLFFVPVINLGIISLYFIDGTKGENKYGKDPKGRINEKKFSNNKKSKVQPNSSTSLILINNKLQLLQESLDDGILDKKEFTQKNNELLQEKQKLITLSENEIIINEKSGKLKKLLENGIISQTEYDIKLKDLYSSYGFESCVNAEIHLETKLFYIANGKEFGPIRTSELISLLNTNKINPNCLVRTQNEDSYGKRAYEILELFV